MEKSSTVEVDGHIDYEDWISNGPSNLYFSYWNDPKNHDIYNILDSDFKKLDEFISKIGLYDDILKILQYLEENKTQIGGQGLDVAAGNLWTTAYLLNKVPSIKQMTCLEYSKHRLLNVGLKLLKYYNVDRNKVKIVHGDFYDIRLQENSIDFVVLCGTLHHASDPVKLLEQVSKVLKKGGLAIVVGDPYIRKLKYFKCLFKYIILLIFYKLFLRFFKGSFFDKVRNINYNLTFREMYFPTDQVTGDHYHLRNEYNKLFRKNFAIIEFVSVDKNRLSFLLIKK